MGFFDLFRKEVEEQETEKAIKKMKKQPKDSPYEIKAIKNNEEKIQIDFNEKNANFKQFYDTTRLIIDGDRKDINSSVKECRVSWYGEQDAVMLDDNGNEFGRQTDYTTVLMDLDIKELLGNREYCTAVMKWLLNKGRVEKYIERGLQENPEVPCGNYLGGIRKDENGYKKVFDIKTGRQVHESLEMVAERRMHQKAEEEKQKEMARKNRERIAKLKKQIEDLSNEK